MEHQTVSARDSWMGRARLAVARMPLPVKDDAMWKQWTQSRCAMAVWQRWWCAVSFVVTLLSVTGCHSVPVVCDRDCVSSKVAARTGHSLVSELGCGQVVFPNGASLSDGLSEEEAVLIALWNNAAFQEQLVDWKIAHGDLVQAGLLPNPELYFVFAAVDKPYKYAVDFPIEALWLRPIRIAAAERESARVCERLTQLGLDLIRDTRQAYADLQLARGRLRVADQAEELRQRITSFAQKRLDGGDASPQELATAKIDSLQAKQDVARIRQDVALAEERLRNLLGLSDDRTQLTPTDPAPPVRGDFDADVLSAEAVSSRPDLLAVAQAADAAHERLRLAELGWFRFFGIADATNGFRTGHAFGGGMRVTLPIFNHNEGAIARAEAEWEKLCRQKQTMHNQIVLDVRQAHLRYAQARAELEVLDGQTRPEVAAAIERASAAYRDGDVGYILVLQTSRQLIDTELRQEQLHAELRRAWAELERSVGRHLDVAAADAPSTITPPPAPAAQ